VAMLAQFACAQVYVVSAEADLGLKWTCMRHSGRTRSRKSTTENGETQADFAVAGI
jgi:hypothetical protein